ncbi:response regulator transcription factor [Mucilaginibacter glaciei]|uniref:Response regulator transcription factor n=1 Tax=Mucilaginibacter glaciei TaxID=2772109 RepID=A0A926S3V8_9SPHI|nr:response regulator transcription factor [Mucilaginibacter glaciei]MBD1395322.1 response regulator transcription factor [Mucilaginibacter glaciei]
MSEINIAIVDDQNLFRQSLALLINFTEGFNLVAECEGGQHLLDRLANDSLKIDVAIIDMDMPGMNGIELNKLLQKSHPKIKVIILSVHVNEILVTQMINTGAASYLAKNCDKNELSLAIRTVYKTGFYFNNDALKAIRNSGNHRLQTVDALTSLPVALTDRETEILKLVCQEYSNAEIGAELFLSARTVEGYRIKIINKINCRNTAGMVLFAIKHGIVELSL